MTQTYRIRLRQLVLSCSIGAYEHERRERQPVAFTVALDVLDPGSFASDDLKSVFNYERIVDGIKKLTAVEHFDLVETLAERVAALCLADPRARAVTVEVEKRQIYPEAAGIGVAIHRHRAPD